MVTDITPAEGIDEGDGRTFTASITTKTGEPATVEPWHVTITVKKPSGTTSSAEQITHGSGEVSYRIIFDQPGWWTWRVEWNNGDDLPEVEEARAYVRPRRVPKE